ncbi:uncharacterized protein LOC125845691 [Solanum stenotomum]|uniref:uncharacterized protein LOC125845691 n=1 Tax=Solanum stenotomum TaxID=172797 RepID=UPI0020D0A7E3|nr:uncharacterized protein LOC125845691 [Solanum stenotomum]
MGDAPVVAPQIDFSSLLYLHPSENADSTLLPVVFDGTGALSVKSKTGFITGKVVKPTSTDPSFPQWERCDDMLQKEINDLVQGTLDITGYYTKMKKLWEEMNTLDVHSQGTCVCVCGGKAKMHQAEQDKRLVHFLMGSRVFRTNYASSRGGTNSPNPNTNTNTVFRGNSSTGNRSNLFCDFCKRTGHTKDRCYKLHGYPSNSRPPKGRSSGSAANAYSSEEDRNHNEESDESKRQMPLNLSKGQYEQLLNLLGFLQAGNGTDGSRNMFSGAVNLAGPFSEEPSSTW